MNHQKGGDERTRQALGANQGKGDDAQGKQKEPVAM